MHPATWLVRLVRAATSMLLLACSCGEVARDLEAATEASGAR